MRVALSSDGHGQAVWDSGVPASRIVRAAELSGTTFGAVQNLSTPGVNTNADSLVADSYGGFVTTWRQGAIGATNVFASVRSGSQWGAPAQLGPGYASQVAIDPVTRVPLAVVTSSNGVFYSKNAG